MVYFIVSVLVPGSVIVMLGWLLFKQTRERLRWQLRAFVTFASRRMMCEDGSFEARQKAMDWAIEQERAIEHLSFVNLLVVDDIGAMRSLRRGTPLLQVVRTEIERWNED